MRIVYLLACCSTDDEAALDGVEFFAGAMAITLSMQWRGFDFVPYDILKNPIMDLLSARGIRIITARTFATSRTTLRRLS